MTDDDAKLTRLLQATLAPTDTQMDRMRQRLAAVMVSRHTTPTEDWTGFFYGMLWARRTVEQTSQTTVCVLRRAYAI